MRRVLAAAGMAVLLAATSAHAQESGSRWTDPEPTSDIEGTPLAYLSEPQQLSGVAARDGWNVDSVSFVGVPGDEPSECKADVPTQQGGAQFSFDASFPCNRTYLVRATAHLSRRATLGTETDEIRLPLYVAAAIPPAAVDSVKATLSAEGDDRSVRLDWPANDEPDLLGYVVTRTTGEKTTSLGQVDAGDDLELVDDDPPSGTSSAYSVIAVRQGPDSTVKQVPSEPTTVKVDVPSDDVDGQSSGEGGTGSGLTTVVTGAPSQGKPDSKLLSSVNARGGNGAPRTPPTTFDSGFQEALPFQPGDDESAAAPPTGTGDPAVVATFDEGGQESLFGSKGAMTFIAGGLAVLVGAAVLFYVSRRAAREAY
jgi:hypothetical protein